MSIDLEYNKNISKRDEEGEKNDRRSEFKVTVGFLNQKYPTLKMVLESMIVERYKLFLLLEYSVG